jgi:hypothetical protein
MVPWVVQIKLHTRFTPRNFRLFLLWVFFYPLFSQQVGKQFLFDLFELNPELVDPFLTHLFPAASRQLNGTAEVYHHSGAKDSRA